MSVPIKRLQDLARQIPASERRTVERFMEFVIADSDDQPTPEEIAMMKISEEEIAKGDVVEWTPGMFSKSSSPKVAAKRSIGTRLKSAKTLMTRSKKSVKTRIAESI